jgi:hypothetical protein
MCGGIVALFTTVGGAVDQYVAKAIQVAGPHRVPSTAHTNYFLSGKANSVKRMPQFFYRSLNARCADNPSKCVFRDKFVWALC